MMTAAIRCNLCEPAMAPRQPNNIAGADELAAHLDRVHQLAEYRDRSWYLRHFGFGRR